jgi:hypothetical protein
VYTSLITLGGCNASGSYGLGMFVGFGYKKCIQSFGDETSWKKTLSETEKEVGR